MSFMRGGVRRSTKKRKFTEGEDNSEVYYDEVWNACYKIRKDMKVITKLLKSCKPKRPAEPIRLQDVIAYVINAYHKNASKLNEELRVEFQEVHDLKRQKDQQMDEMEKKHKDDMNRMRQEHYDEIKKHKKADEENEERIRSSEEELKGLREQINSLNAELDGRAQIIKEKEESISSLTQKINDLSKEKERLQQEIQDEKRQFHSTNNTFQQDIGKLQQEIDNLKRVVTQREKELQNSQTEIYSLNSNLHKYQSAIQALSAQSENEKKSLQDENERINRNIHQLRRELNEVIESRDDEKIQKDEALTRLSAIAGDRLRNNNPGITDLSDPNRPMKIAEKFTEMYDNDWTDAMEALEDSGLEEKESVQILLHFLTDSYEECGRRVTELDNMIEKAILMSSADTQVDESGDARQDIPAEITKPIKDLRKKMTANNVEVLQKILPQLLKDKRNITEEQLNGCEAFVKDCIKYAWMMQIQDPPVYIEWEFPEETKIDTNILRSYTKAGEKVDFIVWPVLYLHKDGPVLNKGVVQPIPK